MVASCNLKGNSTQTCRPMYFDLTKIVMCGKLRTHSGHPFRIFLIVYSASLARLHVGL